MRPKLYPTPLVAAALLDAARATGIDVSVLRAIAYVESRFRPDARGPKTASGWTAVGLMQLGPLALKQFAITDGLDAGQNAMGGARLLLEYLRRYHGSLEHALAAYNWGPGNVDAHPTLPASVQLYVESVRARLETERAETGTPRDAPAFVAVGRDAR